MLKQIIILIFAVCCLFSQDLINSNQDSVAVKPEQQLELCSVYIDTLKPVLIIPQWLIQLNFLWQEYKEFCRTDTTEEYRKYQQGIIDRDYFYPDKYPYIISMTRIPEFGDFMNWVEEKYIKPKGN